MGVLGMNHRMNSSTVGIFYKLCNPIMHRIYYIIDYTAGFAGKKVSQSFTISNLPGISAEK